MSITDTVPMSAGPTGVSYANYPISDLVNSGRITKVDHPDAAMKMAEFYNVVNMISNTVASLSFNFYKDHIKLSASDYDQVRLWKYEMYPGLPPFKVLKAFVMNGLKGGNGYMIIERDKMLRPISYINRMWNEMYPFRTTDGRIWYYDTVTKMVFPHYDVMHLADITGDALIGKTKVQHQAETLGRSKAANDFVNKYFGKGLFLGGVIEYPVGSGITEEDLPGLEKSASDNFGGVDKSGQVMIVTEGGQLKQFKTDIPLGDAGYLEGEKLTKADIRGMFGVPDEISDEASLTRYHNDAVLPIIKCIEAEINLKVVRPSEMGVVYGKFEMDSILRADASTRANVIEKYLRNSLMTINEARALDDRAPIPGGDDPMVMANNMVPLAQLQDFVNSKMT